MDDLELLETGRALLRDEARCVDAVADRVGIELVRAARLVTDCTGRVVVSGIGKSGLVGRKIAATFASLGIPAFFLHATEAFHGDLGMVCADDVGLFISNSGETEVVMLIPHFRRIGAHIIGFTGRGTSTLAKESDIWLDTSVERESDPLGLAPTNSTTVQMAMGDAVAAISVRLNGLRAEDFARVHPGGALGKKLLLRVSDLMSSGGDLPVVSSGASVRDALFEITSKGCGATCVTGPDGALMGIFTDGDLRRLMERAGAKALDMPVDDGMTKTPKTVEASCLAAAAAGMMERMEISVIIVTDGSERPKPIGMVHLHEIMRAGVI